MKYDNKNMLKLQISTYLEESLSMVGRMMLEDVFNDIDVLNEDEAKAMCEAYYDDNVFELIAPYLQHAAEEYEAYKHTPEGLEALQELKDVMNQAKQQAEEYKQVKTTKVNNDDNEGNGNVH